MGSVERIATVARRVAKWVRAGYQVVIVPSAMSGETNRLLSLAEELIPEQKTPSVLRELDAIASTGEQVSVGLLSLALQREGVDAISFAGWQVPVKTDTAYTRARIESIDAAHIHTELQQGRVVIVTGFQGITADGNVATLGRGGSDTSAVAVAAAIGAKECLIFTDVDGVYTTDPRVVKKARRMRKVTFEEMLEMASMGSKVLQIRSVEFAGKYKIPLRVLSSFTEPDIPIEEESQSGTLITLDEEKNMEKAVVSGIAFNKDEAKISLLNVPDEPGVASRILGAVADNNIEVDMIIQDPGHQGKNDFTFTVHRKDYEPTLELLRTGIAKDLGMVSVEGNPDICKVSIVGIGMRSHAGVASTMFKALGNEGINIIMISTSEIKTSVVIHEKYMELAVRALHKAFGLENEPQEES